MNGLLLLAVVVAWSYIAKKMATGLTQSINRAPLRAASSVIMFAALFVLPFIDELIGMHQFSVLCRNYGSVVVDETAKNRRAILMPIDQAITAPGTMIDVRIDPWIFKDAETGSVIASYHRLHASGGWLIRFLGISEKNSPLLFEGYCSPPNKDEFKTRLNITVVN